MIPPENMSLRVKVIGQDDQTILDQTLPLKPFHIADPIQNTTNKSLIAGLKQFQNQINETLTQIVEKERNQSNLVDMDEELDDEEDMESEEEHVAKKLKS